MSLITDFTGKFNFRDYNTVKNTITPALANDEITPLVYEKVVQFISPTTLSNNAIYYNGNGNLTTKFKDSNTVSVNAKYTARGTTSVIISYDPVTNNMYKLTLSDGEMILRKIVLGKTVETRSYPCSIKANEYHTVTVTKETIPKLDLYCDGNYIGTYNDLAYSKDLNLLVHKEGTIYSNKVVPVATTSNVLLDVPKGTYDYVVTLNGTNTQKATYYIEKYISKNVSVGKTWKKQWAWVPMGVKTVTLNGSNQLVIGSVASSSYKVRFRFVGNGVGTYTVKTLELNSKRTADAYIVPVTLKTLAIAKGGYYYYTFQGKGTGTVVLERLDGDVWTNVENISVSGSTFKVYAKTIDNTSIPQATARYRIKIPTGVQVRNIGLFKPLDTGYSGLALTPIFNENIYIRSFSNSQN